MLNETDEFQSFSIETDKSGMLCAVFYRHVEPASLGAVPLSTGSRIYSAQEWIGENALDQRIKDREAAGQDTSLSRSAYDALRAWKANFNG